MEITKGGRDQLERDLTCELFKPADSQGRIAAIIRRLAPRGKLQLQALLQEPGK